MRREPKGAPERVWYVAYGSNMLTGRLHYYLAGGRPPGAARTYPGCRDPRPPAESRPVTLPGGVFFALESASWTGGMAFYDPDRAGPTAGAAYLITAGQFADLAAQEMHREPGADLPLAEVVRAGRLTLGPGRYETLLCTGTLDGHPMLTFTCPWRSGEVAPAPPAPTYLDMLAAGLRETHRWDDGRIAAYLGNLPGGRAPATAPAG